LPPPSSTGVDADADQITAALAKADASDLAADYAILIAATQSMSSTTPPPRASSSGATRPDVLPMSSPTLLVVWHDALRSVADHLRDASAFHDFACHYASDPKVGPGQDACASLNQANELSEMTALLGAFPDVSTLGQEVERAKLMFKGQDPD